MIRRTSQRLSQRGFLTLAEAAHDARPVVGWTHNFYRYPARFSPRFAATVVELFSRPGEVVLDPYMGGGTAVIEAAAAGRHVIGNDLNSLATFVTRVKTTPLTCDEVDAVRSWLCLSVPSLKYHDSLAEHTVLIDPTRTKNLSLARARFIKKLVARALGSLNDLPSDATRNFVRVVLLRAGQWALDGRSRHTKLSEFRKQLSVFGDEMLLSIQAFCDQVRQAGGEIKLLNVDAKMLHQVDDLVGRPKEIGCVVTSPPYPGVHVLYHRWQVDGRRETPAPYWISGCNDGQGASFYNFGDRRQAAADNYFATSLDTLKSIRQVMRCGGHIVQMLAFNKPDEQLQRYLKNMINAGYEEVRARGADRIWRPVPRRKWHANLRGDTHSAREVVLVHRAV